MRNALRHRWNVHAVAAALAFSLAGAQRLTASMEWGRSTALLG